MLEHTILSSLPLLLAGLLGLAVLAGGVYVARRTVRRAKRAAREILEEARLDAEARAQELLVEVQERELALSAEADRRERELDQQEGALETRQRQLDAEAQRIARERREIERRRDDLSRAEERTRVLLEQARAGTERIEAERERVAGLTAQEARAEVVASITEEARHDGTRLARKILDEARAGAEREALQLVVGATQRIRIRDAVESTVTFIALPSDEMKGRIIGREGRNIRALEMATGIDLVVDDTPQAILISSFDPVRREVARVAIERLVEDGRIHPARIEEVVSRVREEVDEIFSETGTQAAFSLGLSELHPRLAPLVGKLRFGTHHGHNLLQHCVEVARIAGYMAGEVGASAGTVHRAGLLHEIGRVDETVSGHTILASAELAGRFGESDEVVHAIRSLHPDVESRSMEALLLQTADRVSTNRPGARKDNLEIFLERLRRLERIARSFDGVERAFAVKAGKEIRVLVDSHRVSDERAHELSREIAHRLEHEIAYPGSIKVSVIRETRAVQYAV